MDTKVDKTTVSPGSGNISGTNTPTGSQKVSMFSAKAGFVIPKNKLLGSMVPIFRRGTKLGVTDSSDGESNRQVKRKTKWGSDLTVDVAVRKGRALAYQIRVDQITQLLSSGTLEATEFQEELIETKNIEEKVSLAQVNDEVLKRKSEMLELEKLEAIGEILKLNPSFKVPSNYKPLLKEEKFPIPVKEFPGFNFIGLIYGPNGENRKRLEKETGAKIKICGIKAGMTVKVISSELEAIILEIFSDPRDLQEEIKPTDGIEIQSLYGELSVHISADTFDKIDAAASVVEILLTSISENLPAISTSSVDSTSVLNQREDVRTSGLAPGAVLHQGVVQQVTESGQSSVQGQFQYPGQWLQPGPSHIPMQSPRFISPPNPSAPVLEMPVYTSPSAPSNLPSLFGHPPVQGVGFNANFRNPPVFPSRFHSPAPMQQQQPHMVDLVGTSGFPSMVAQRPSLVRPLVPAHFSFPGSQPPPTELSVPSRPQPMLNVSPGSLLERPHTPSDASLGWPGALGGTPSPVLSNIRQMTVPMDLVHRPPEPRGLSSNLSGNMNTMPRLELPSSFPAPLQPTLVPTHAPRPLNHSGGSAPISSLARPSFPSQPLQSGMQTALGSMPINAPKQHPMATSQGSGEFSFQPSQGLQHSAAQAMQVPAAHNILQPPAPQLPSFRFSVPPTSTPRPVNQVFPHPQVGGLVGQHQGQMPSNLHSGLSMSPRLQGFPDLNFRPTRTPSPHMVSPSFGPTPPNLNPMVAFPPMPPNVVQPQHNYPSRGIRPELPLGRSQQFMGSLPFTAGKPPSASGGQQIYDPFSPTTMTVTPKQQPDGNPS